MDNDIKRLIGVLVVGGIIFLLVKPNGVLKSVVSKPKNFSAPKTAQASDVDYENSIIAIKAMRAAINAGESPAALEDLNREILADYDIKVYQAENTKKLYTCNRNGKEIARES